MPPPDVVLVVRTAPVPEIAPAELVGVIDDVRDIDGDLVDWVLIDHDDTQRSGDVPGVLGAASAFWAWRRTWERRHAIGPARELRALRDVVRSVEQGEPSALDELLAAVCASSAETTRLDLDLIRAAEERLEDVRTAVDVTGGTGWAIIDDMPGRRSGRTLRTWTVPEEPYVVAASPVTSVIVHPSDGLVVETAVPGATWSSRLGGIVEVDLIADPVVLTDAEGRSEVLDITAARPLAWLVPTSLRWSVRPVPLVEVWRSFFEALPQVLSTPNHPGAVTISTRVPVG